MSYDNSKYNMMLYYIALYHITCVYIYIYNDMSRRPCWKPPQSVCTVARSLSSQRILCPDLGRFIGIFRGLC